MENKLCFLVEDYEVEVPEHFELFSVVVDNYIKTYSGDSDGLPKKGECVIPLNNFKKDHLQLILDFFNALKEHSSPQQNATDVDDGCATQTGLEQLSVKDPVFATLSHLSAEVKLTKLPDWAQEFFEKVPKEHLFQASMLANYLLAHSFIEHAAFFIANKLKSFGSVSEMREYMNAKNDFKKNEFDLLANDPSWRERLLAEGIIDEEK